MKKRILCYGDSNTWGYDPAHMVRYDESVRWTCLLQEKLGSDYAVVEEGLCGRTTVWDDPTEGRVSGLAYLQPCLDSQSPIDLVIIMLGTNDAKQYFGVNAYKIADSAGRLADFTMRSNYGVDGSTPKVLLVAPARIKNHPVFIDCFGPEAEEKSHGFSKWFRKKADELGCYFLDAADHALPSEEDGLHFSPESHAALADAMYKKVLEIL